MQTRHSLRLAVAREVAKQERRDLPQKTSFKKQETEDDSKHKRDHADIGLSNMRERRMLEHDHRSGTAAAAQSTLKGRASTQNLLLESRDHYDARSHRRRMEHLSLAKAIPVDVPFPTLSCNAPRWYIEH